jgi:TolA-binding protein
MTRRATQQDLERAIELARRVDAPMPGPARVEEVRTALLAAASFEEPVPARGPRRWWWGGVLAAAAAVMLAVVVARSTSLGRATGAHRHGTIHAHRAAIYTPPSSSPDEIVMLHDGTIDVDVAPLHAGERFRVVVGDAEIEVHGTAFAVTARAGRLVEVVVQHGVVEVRTRDERRTLTAGESWRDPTRTATVIAPAPVAPAPVVPAPVVPAPVAAATRAPVVRAPVVPAPAPPSPAAAEPAAPALRLPEEVAYDDGWTAMRAGRFTDAASAFARVQALAPTGSLAEDAGFWYAVALARANQPALAITAFRDYLDAFPTSRRAGEASAMLGWLLVDARNSREAARRFRAAIADPDSTIRASAEAGLAAVARMPSPATTPRDAP